jgi:hypothetical protein
MGSPGDNVDAQLRQLTTLMYADIQMLKAGEHRQLISKLRQRFLKVVGVAILVGGYFIWYFRGELTGQVWAIVIAAFVVLWGVTRLLKLSRIERHVGQNAGQVHEDSSEESPV